jgi:hypothetical protein
MKLFKTGNSSCLSLLDCSDMLRIENSLPLATSDHQMSDRIEIVTIARTPLIACDKKLEDRTTVFHCQPLQHTFLNGVIDIPGFQTMPFSSTVSFRNASCRNLSFSSSSIRSRSCSCFARIVFFSASISALRACFNVGCNTAFPCINRDRSNALLQYDSQGM